jgi:hypothetical protein
VAVVGRPRGLPCRPDIDSCALSLFGLRGDECGWAIMRWLALRPRRKEIVAGIVPHAPQSRYRARATACNVQVGQSGVRSERATVQKERKAAEAAPLWE